MKEKPLKTVLLIEDEPADAYLVRMAFKESKILLDLQHVEDGLDALTFLHKQAPYQDAKTPDLILLDLNMPRMDGLTFLKKIKAIDNLRRIPVVVLTTSEAENDIIASYDLGAAGFIVKPVDAAQFVKAVQVLDDYWMSLVHRAPSQVLS